MAMSNSGNQKQHGEGCSAMPRPKNKYGRKPLSLATTGHDNVEHSHAPPTPYLLSFSTADVLSDVVLSCTSWACSRVINCPSPFSVKALEGCAAQSPRYGGMFCVKQIR